MTNPPFRLEGIDHVLLLVQGMEKALAFYEGVLGARIDSRLPQFGMVELSAGGSHIDIVDTTAPEGHWALPDYRARNFNRRGTPRAGRAGKDRIVLRSRPLRERYRTNRQSGAIESIGVTQCSF